MNGHHTRAFGLTSTLMALAGVATLTGVETVSGWRLPLLIFFTYGSGYFAGLFRERTRRHEDPPDRAL